MSNFLIDFTKNSVLISGICAWAIAQILKFIIYFIVNKKLDFERLFGDGGMPSGHSATVSAMAMTSFIVYGVSSFEFAISFMLAIIVMHDAKGVRLETGKQAKVIKELTDCVEKITNLTVDFSDESLKDFVGHTPLQVFFGGLLGMAISLIYCFLILKI